MKQKEKTEDKELVFARGPFEMGDVTRRNTRKEEKDKKSRKRKR